MATKNVKSIRSTTGYGSSYRRAAKDELSRRDEIGSVLGGQVWLVKPDKEAQAENPCLWMAAGVVEFKSCNNYYDCVTCRYDQGMLKQVEKGKTVSWQDAMRRRPDLERVCRHSLTGRIPRRLCAFDFRCATCDFDQFFEDVWAAKTKSLPREIQQVKGFDMPTGYYFHRGHSWARIESGGFIRIGMDDFALKLLGRADALDLPLMGKEMTVDTAGWGLKRRENLADVLAPVDGVVVEVNARVRENPHLANSEPYGDGWLMLVRTPEIKRTIGKLMTDTQGLEWMNGEITRLEGMIEQVAGPLAADGGLLQEDIFGNLPDLGWQNLVSGFLKT